ALKIVVMTREQGTGNREQVTGYRLQVTGYRLQVLGKFTFRYLCRFFPLTYLGNIVHNPTPFPCGVRGFQSLSHNIMKAFPIPSPLRRGLGRGKREVFL
ncbi:MAG: hypothetical protein ACLBM2_07410, partial [Dolichospermum sp.]